MSWDIVRVLRPGTEDQTLLLISRVVILVVGVFSILFALTRIPLFEINLLALGMFVAGLFVPLMGALFYRHSTTAGAMSATLTGVGTVITLQFMGFALGVESPVQPVLAGLGLSAAIFFIVCHFTWSEHIATRPALA